MLCQYLNALFSTFGGTLVALNSSQIYYFIFKFTESHIDLVRGIRVTEGSTPGLIFREIMKWNTLLTTSKMKETNTLVNAQK